MIRYIKTKLEETQYMKHLHYLFDKAAISLSFACAIHCLATPLLLVMLPSLASLNLDTEAFHVWMLAVVIPISILGFTMGCKKHKRYRVISFGIVGVCFLVSALMFGEDWEKVLTLIGAAIISFGHFLNYKLCRQVDRCQCTSETQHSE